MMCETWHVFSACLFRYLNIFLDVYIHGGWQAMFQYDKKPPQPKEFISVFPNFSGIEYKSI